MSNTVNTNMMSMVAQKHLSKNGNALSTAMQRLSSGLRINSAADDSAGLAIAERFGAQVRGLNQATRNAQDGISLAQTAEGALTEVGEMLQRMRELSVQSSNGIYTSADRANLSNEYKALANEISRTLESTEFNGKKILESSAGSFNIQIGANNASNNRVTISTVNMKASLSAVTAVSIGTSALARSALDKLDTAIDSVTKMRAGLGSAQNRLNYSVNNLRNSAENQMAARARIMDADFAQETANLSRAQILQQAGTAMLAQANNSSQATLALL